MKAHVFLCLLAYYVECQMKQKPAPLLYAEEDREGAKEACQDIVSPTVPYPATQKRVQTHRKGEGLPVQSFRSLLADLGTLTRNVMQTGKDAEFRFSMLARLQYGKDLFLKDPEGFQAKALRLAVQNNIAIANPELQERIQREKEQIASEREQQRKMNQCPHSRSEEERKREKGPEL